MRRCLLAVVPALLAVAAPVHAGERFEAYQGPDAVWTGWGGTQVSEGGMEYWTRGTPARKFQIIGFITDSRRAPFSGKLVGSKSIARQVVALGGHGVIVIDPMEEMKGAYPFGQAALIGLGPSREPYFDRSPYKEVTRLVVFRYPGP